jgi:hypothetical protein
MGSVVRSLVLAVLVVLGVGNVSAAPQATETRSCAQVFGFFNVQLIGDRAWGWNLDGLGSVGVPKKRAVIVVWSLGGVLPGGLNVYGWATAKRSRPSPRCTVVKRQLRSPSLADLGPITRVEDGWAFGRKFVCLEPGRVLVTTTQSRGKTRVVVRMERSGRVMAVGELEQGGAWIRGSKRCDDREK